MQNPHDLVEGMVIDGFRLGEKVHVGGMAALWRVTRDDVVTPIVMKVPTIYDSDDPATIVGFEMEQMILPLLSGPHVPRFVALGEVGPQPYIVMEYVEGRSLLPKLDAAPLPVDEVVAIAAEAARALDDVHRQHVIHLDIKPSNVMLRPDGGVVLIDFGLSHHDMMPDLLAEELHLPIGTGPYISPEQIRHDRSDPRSDIFSLGVLLYHLLTHQRPFGFPRSPRGLRRRLWRDPTPPRAIVPDCPPYLQEIVLRCLEPDPEQRYPTAAQLLFDLKHPDKVAPTERGERVVRDGLLTTARRRWEIALAPPKPAKSIAQRMSLAPIVMAAIDLDDTDAVSDVLRAQVQRVLATTPSARLACVNILRTNRIALNYPLDTEGQNIHVMRLVNLRTWAKPLGVAQDKITFHVLEAPEPAQALVDYARLNSVDHVVIGAQARFTTSRRLGSVATRLVAELPCTVTVVRGRSQNEAG